MKPIVTIFFLFNFLIIQVAYPQCGSCNTTYSTNRGYTGMTSAGHVYCFDIVGGGNSDITLGGGAISKSKVEVCTDVGDTVVLTAYMGNYGTPRGELVIYGNFKVENSMSLDKLDILIEKGGSLTANKTITINTGSTITNKGTFRTSAFVEMNSGTFNNQGSMSVVNFNMNGSSDFNADSASSFTSTGTVEMNSTSRIDFSGAIMNFNNLLMNSNSSLNAGTTPNCGGAIIAGSINMGSSTSITGDMSITDNTPNSTGDNYNGKFTNDVPNTCQTVLPIELLSFTGKYINSKKIVELYWITASETNNSHFVLEKSFDGINFMPFATINGAGNSSKKINYMTYDEAPLISVTFYRLKQIDYDGEYTYSKIISVSSEQEKEFNIYPNPANDYFIIEPTFQSKQIIYYLTNLFEQKVTPIMSTTNESGSYFLDCSELSSGVYSIHIKMNEHNFVKKVIVAH